MQALTRNLGCAVELFYILRALDVRSLLACDKDMLLISISGGFDISTDSERTLTLQPCYFTLPRP